MFYIILNIIILTKKEYSGLIIFNSVLAIKIGSKANSTGLSHTVIQSGFLQNKDYKEQLNKKQKHKISRYMYHFYKYTYFKPIVSIWNYEEINFLLYQGQPTEIKCQFTKLTIFCMTKTVSELCLQNAMCILSLWIKYLQSQQRLNCCYKGNCPETNGFPMRRCHCYTSPQDNKSH